MRPQPSTLSPVLRPVFRKSPARPRFRQRYLNHDAFQSIRVCHHPTVDGACSCDGTEDPVRGRPPVRVLPRQVPATGGDAVSRTGGASKERERASYGDHLVKIGLPPLSSATVRPPAAPTVDRSAS